MSSLVVGGERHSQTGSGVRGKTLDLRRCIAALLGNLGIARDNADGRIAKKRTHWIALLTISVLTTISVPVVRDTTIDHMVGLTVG